MQYNLTDYTVKNKFPTLVSTNFSLSFNYVMLNNFSGEAFDIITPSGNLSLYTVKNTRNKLEITDNRFLQTFIVDFPLIATELYNIVISYTVSLKQISIKIFSLKNKEKFLEYQNIYISTNADSTPFEINYIHLFGGNFYSSEIAFIINDKQILKDIVNPLLQIKQF